MASVVIPPPLRPGARIHVIAPSSPFEAEPVRQGIAWLRERYRVTHDPRLFERRAGFLAGTDAERLAELQEAFDAPDVGAVVAARGGYGLLRIADRLDWTTLRSAPRWIVGFSDITVLHGEAARRGIASLHARNVSGLGLASASERAQWVQALEAPDAAQQWSGLTCWSPGHAEGLLFGGNLTLLFALAAAGSLELPAGCVLLLEDVTETSYRIDRMLTALIAGKHLQRASAIVLGDFTDCSPGKHQVPVEEVLRERLVNLGLPVVAGFPFGHGDRNEPVVLGRRARVSARPEQTVVELTSSL